MYFMWPLQLMHIFTGPRIPSSSKEMVDKGDPFTGFAEKKVGSMLRWILQWMGS